MVTPSRNLFARPLVAIGLALLLAVAMAAPEPWRAVYAGQLGGEYVLVDLTRFGDDSASARVLLQARGLSLSGSGTEAEDGTIAIDLRATDLRDSPSFAVLYGMLPDEQPATGQVIAHLQAVRHDEWTDDGAVLSTALTFTAATEDAATLEGDLARAAQYAYLSLSEGRIEASAVWPRFSSAALKDLEQEQESDGYSQLRAFVADGRATADSLELGWGWTEDTYRDVMGVAGAYVSILRSTTNYTGGAHPNTGYDSTLFDTGTSGYLYLDDLFDETVDWETPVLALVTADLQAQGAAWLEEDTDSTLAVTLTIADLETFTLGPTGLSFMFGPYAVGPYAQGAFEVTLPYASLAGLGREDGPLAAFRDAALPTVFD
ncbi:MAG: DUF3298 domain-containing protein [Trueperaceae bacterium]|nr:DUF3298 domain-containing protein [Trueperaceae bacterium]MCO5173865.1 RsiV family protein [Trueperaceae bacterium]MCW5818979.1 DUF3298 domain-containing protein [Trueperaceae bacterium]